MLKCIFFDTTSSACSVLLAGHLHVFQVLVYMKTCYDFLVLRSSKV